MLSNVLHKLHNEGNKKYGKWSLNKTQTHIIGNIFYNLRYNFTMSNREVQTRYGIKWLTQNMSNDVFAELKTVDEFIDWCCKYDQFLPGDLQRQMRTFHEKYEKFGLQKIGESSNVKYVWKSELTDEDITLLMNDDVKAPRNIFKTSKERKNFVKEKSAKCEMCNSQRRLAVDHWRAHKIYNIDNKGLAVLLCEHCNNIHHDYDAIHILDHHLRKDNLTMDMVWKWIDIESNVRKEGFYPNAKDKDEQVKTIDKIINEYNNKTCKKEKKRWLGVIEELQKMR